MKLQKRGAGETLIILPTDANRNMGIFLIYLGLTASFPVWYLICTWFLKLPRTINDWFPALLMAAAGVLSGFLLVVNSRKRILVGSGAIQVWDGLFRKPLRFTWTTTPAIRLQQLDTEGKRKSIWITKLVNERYEYTLDERLGQQLQSRALAEALAKALGCPLLEKMPDGSELRMEARDLDLPFRERVNLYPNLLGSPIEKPAGTPIAVVEEGGSRRFVWGVATSGLFVDVIALGLFFVLISAIPPSPDAQSMLESSRERGDYRLYIALAGVISAFLVLVAGFRVNLKLSPESVTLRETLWGLPIGRHSIRCEQVEEVHLSPHVRGPIVQVVSDTAIFGFRVTDLQTAAWLAYEVRRHLTQAVPVPA